MTEFTLKVRINEDEIANGCRYEASNCPGALATLREMREQHPELDTVGVTVGGIYTYVDVVTHRDADGKPVRGTSYMANQPDVLRTFVREFDNERDVKPISYELSFRPSYPFDGDPMGTH